MRIWRSVAILGLWAAFVALGLVMLAGSAEAHGRRWHDPQSGVETMRRSVAIDTVAVALRDLGRGNFTGFRGQWCAFGLSRWLVESGHRPLPNGMALSALRYGPHVAGPKRGAIVVMRSHVGLVEAVLADGSILMVSANWGHRVARGIIQRRQVLAFVEVI